MFESLSGRLLKVFDGLSSRGVLNENDVNNALREIRIALLEADVALSVVKNFIENIREEAVGEKILKSIKPGEVVVKIVYDKLVDLLGSEEDSEIKFTRPPSTMLLLGLQGSGKTTTAGKIALKLKKEKKKILLCSLDIRRPAAMEQLQQLAKSIDVPILPFNIDESITSIIGRAIKEAKEVMYDLVIFDTAGRTTLNEDLMIEIQDIYDLSKPSEVLLVVDSMTGQDSVNIAKSFSERVDLTGIVLTRIDGDSRGGAALSMRETTKKPIKYLGVGEKLQDLEIFSAQRVANRILDMGDIVGIVEKAEQAFDEEESKMMAKKLSKGDFNLEDFRKQLNQMKKMGGMKGIMAMLPGIKKAKKMIDSSNFEDKSFLSMEAIISSMTNIEKQNTKIIGGSRKKRIARGSGTQIQEVNRLLKQFKGMQKMMKKMKGPGGSKIFDMLGGNLGTSFDKSSLLNKIKNQNNL